MSKYNDLFGDFGLRCFDLYENGKVVIGNRNRDVTRALCVLSAALTIPHERLRPGRGGKLHHPCGDPSRYPAVGSMYEAKLREEFMRSLGVGGNWKTGSLRGSWGTESCPPPGYERALGTEKVKRVLEIMRNALAHAFVQTTADGNHQINEVRFLGLPKPQIGGAIPGTPFDADYLLADLEGLTKFMGNWRDFLNALELIVTGP